MTKNQPRYNSLPQILEDLNEDRATRIKVGVILTYEFDPVLARSLARTALLQLDDDLEDGKLRFAGAFPICLFFDPKRSRNLPNFPGNFEIHFKSKKGYACHHSKAYTFALQDGTFELIFGSFNLTESGLFYNRETFVQFTLDDNPSAGVLSIYRQWRDFLTNNYLPTTNSNGLTEYLTLLNEKLETQTEQDSDSSLKLLYSGYSDANQGLDSLKKFCQAQTLLKPTRLLVISPFFDKDEKSNKRLLQLFHEEFPSLQCVSVFSSFDVWGKSFFEGFNDDGVRCFQIPNKTTEAENAAIDSFHLDSKSKLANVGRQFDRSLHAKALLLLDDNGKGVLYIGSANFSVKAWLGRNFELGIAGVCTIANAGSSNWDKTFVEHLLGVKVEKIIPCEDAPSVPDSEVDNDPSGSQPPEWLESILLTIPATSESSGTVGNGNFSLAGQFLFFKRHGYEFPNPSEIRDRFKFGSLDLSLIERLTVKGKYCLASNVFSLNELKEHLAVSRVVTMEPETVGANKLDSVYIPFNVDPVFGRSTEVAVLIKPENGLRFLTDLLSLVPQSSKDEEINNDAIDKIYSEHQYKNGEIIDQKLTKTHLMRRWISDLGKLEKTLIKSGLENEDDTLALGKFRGDLFTSLLAYAATLIQDDIRFADKPLSNIEKTFMVMELAILAARLGAAAAKSSAPIHPEQKATVIKLRNLAYKWVSLYRPSGSSTEENPYKMLLQHYCNKFLIEES